MKKYLNTLPILFLSMFMLRCTDPCDIGKTEIVVDIDQVAFLEQLSGENLDPNLVRVADSLANLDSSYNQTLLFDLIEFYKEGGREPDELFSSFPSQEMGDFSALEGFWVAGSDDAFRYATKVLERRFTAYENMCATSSMEKDGLHIWFADSLSRVGDELRKIPGHFDILEAANYDQWNDFFDRADSIMTSMDTSGGTSVSFRGMFNPDVMPDPSSPVIGESTVADSGKIGAFLRHPEIRKLLEAKGADLLWTKADAMVGGNVREAGLQLVGVKRNTSDNHIGINIREAFVGGIEEKPAVRVSLNAAGARDLRKITEDSQGKSVAMVLDGVIWQLAKVSEPLIDGRFELTGGLSREQSNILAVVLSSGELPVPLVLR